MINSKYKIELIAPAGDLLKLKTAIAYGADAVYLGIPDFSLRTRINDFNLKKIEEAVKIAKAKKIKIYITVNIFAHNYHLKKIVPFLKIINKLKPSALIFSDPGFLFLLKKYCPKINLHLSTQANCTNYEAVKFWQKQGVKRIILGREVGLKEIKEIRKKCPKIELEYFIHGAMCMAYSGRCFLSKDFVDRSANLGDCIQPCRWEYDVFLKTKDEKHQLELVQKNNGTYLLNSKDLCLIRSIKDLVRAGVNNFKIEGRAKSVYYLGNIISIYKKAIKNPEKINFLYKELVEKITNRGYTNGFLLNEKAEQNIDNSHLISGWEFCGQVISNKKIKDFNNLRIKVHNTIKVGDQIELILPEYNIVKFIVDRIIDVNSGKELLIAHGGGGNQEIILEIKSKLDIPELSVLRRKIVN